MADRFPLILNTSANQIQEIASGDQLDLSGNNIANAGVITATSFVGSGAALTGIDATAIKDSGGNVKVQAQASGAVYTGIHTFNSGAEVGSNIQLGNAGVVTATTFKGNGDFVELDVDGHTNLDNVSVAGVVTATTFSGSGASLTGIVNGNISASAAIAGTKISPNFGSQNIVTTGTLGSGNFSLTSTQPRIRLIDSNTNPDLSIINEDGVLNIYDDTNSASRFTIDTGKIVSKLNHDFDAGIDVTGNVIASGNVTAVDGTFTGDVSIGGTLTYEDVTNIDSIGIITARSDIKVGTAVTITSAGAGFFAGIVTASSFVKRDGSAVGGVTSDSMLNTIGGTQSGQNITNSGSSGTSGIENTLYGYGSGKMIEQGDFNTCIGLLAGRNVFNSSNNTFIGYYAGRLMSSSNNTTVGYKAGEANNTSGNLVAFGYEAATSSSSSGRLTAIGYQAGKAHTGGNGNTYVGYQAGHLNGGGDRNVVVGDLTVSGSSDYNRVTVIGASAAGGFGSNANDNTVVGYNAGSSTLTGTNNVIIGSGANLSGNVSNEITLGNASITRFRIPGIGVDLTGPIGITTEALVKTNGQTASLDLSKDDHKVTATGTVTIDVTGGTEASSHTLRIVNSGITTVGFSTYFLFPSGGAPNIPIASGTISLISFTVHRAGAVGVSTQLLSGASVSFA